MFAAEHIALRIANAEQRFLEYAESQGLTAEDARRAMAYLRKLGGRRPCLIIDPILGSFRFSHGIYAEADVLQRAADAFGTYTPTRR